MDEHVVNLGPWDKIRLPTNGATISYHQMFRLKPEKELWHAHRKYDQICLNGKFGGDLGCHKMGPFCTSLPWNCTAGDILWKFCGRGQP